MDVLFPSWGKTAQIEAVLVNGTRAPLVQKGAPEGRVAMRDVAYFYVAGADTGYVVVPHGPARGAAHIMHPKRQSSAPRPGPTLAVQIARQARFKHAGLTVRIAPAATAEKAAEAARRLGARGTGGKRG